MSRIKYILASVFVCLAYVLTFAPRSMAFYLFGDACSGPNAKNTPTCQQAQNEGGDKTNRVTGPKNIINVAANILALITGIGAVIIIIIGGFGMVTSGGNAEAATNARRRIIAAVIGLLIVALAWTFIRFITDKLIQ